ncbi:quaternary ammonium compound efflux SMR transporter SugE [Streptomyces sanglieri]
MSWLLLIGAGLVEIAWSQSIEPTRGFTRPLPTLVCAVLMIGAVYLLARAMEGLPVGTAYAVFTGIGAIGAIALGVLVHHDPVSPGRLAAVALIVGGVVRARMSTPAA